MDMTIHRQCQCHGMLCYCLRRIARYAKHGNAVGIRSSKIYIIKARTSHQYKPYPTLSQYLQHLLTDIRADKSTDCIISLCQSCRLHRQIGFQIIYFHLRKICYYFFKRISVIFFCIIK